MARGVVVSEVPELGADAEKYAEKGIVRVTDTTAALQQLASAIGSARTSS